jgi:hypothetical protein
MKNPFVAVYRPDGHQHVHGYPEEGNQPGGPPAEDQREGAEELDDDQQDDEEGRNAHALGVVVHSGPVTVATEPAQELLRPWGKMTIARATLRMVGRMSPSVCIKPYTVCTKPYTNSPIISVSSLRSSDLSSPLLLWNKYQVSVLGHLDPARH